MCKQYKPFLKTDPEFQKKKLVSRKFVEFPENKIQCDTPLNARGHGFLETEQTHTNFTNFWENNFPSKKITLLRVIPTIAFQNRQTRHTCFLESCVILSCPARY